ncbi:hypothetical protein E2C01_090412 [Portunus trituberculatus]|uniref:Uncharacterized protein n=1 Tax=Portunus trituberculatus TaxID=210409 RepID=A0A5B7JBD1_PORTR|nr:hypothetical protein [Portunus trituberculatus]
MSCIPSKEEGDNNVEQEHAGEWPIVTTEGKCSLLGRSDREMGPDTSSLHQGSKEGGGRKELPPLISPGASQTNPLITVPFPTFGLFAVEVIIIKLGT